MARGGLAGHAHSFAHFHGPVEGPAEEISHHGKHGHHVNYVAHPKYEFSYGVEDHHTGDHHGQKEHRDGESMTKDRSASGHKSTTVLDFLISCDKCAHAYRPAAGTWKVNYRCK